MPNCSTGCCHIRRRQNRVVTQASSSTMIGALATGARSRSLCRFISISRRPRNNERRDDQRLDESLSSVPGNVDLIENPAWTGGNPASNVPARQRGDSPSSGYSRKCPLFPARLWNRRIPKRHARRVRLKPRRRLRQPGLGAQDRGCRQAVVRLLATSAEDRRRLDRFDFDRR